MLLPKTITVLCDPPRVRLLEGSIPGLLESSQTSWDWLLFRILSLVKDHAANIAYQLEIAELYIDTDYQDSGVKEELETLYEDIKHCVAYIDLKMHLPIAIGRLHSSLAIEYVLKE